MEPQPSDLKSIRILFFALLIGQVIFTLIVAALIETGLLSSGNNAVTTMLLVAVIVLLQQLYLLPLFFQKTVAGINPEEELGKLEGYRAALILRMALCEMPVMFAIIVYYVTHDHAFL
jgi:hypothetical protein